MTASTPNPDGYPRLLEHLKRTVAESRWRAQRVVNTELLDMYWRIGSAILEQLEAEGWGTSVIERLSRDLQSAFPGMKGLSPRNLAYMRSFAQGWPDGILQQPAAQLPWTHIQVLIASSTSAHCRRVVNRRVGAQHEATARRAHFDATDLADLFTYR